MFCKECGSNIPDEARFCPVCRAKQNQDEPVKRTPSPRTRINEPAYRSSYEGSRKMGDNGYSGYHTSGGSRIASDALRTTVKPVDDAATKGMVISKKKWLLFTFVIFLCILGICFFMFTSLSAKNAEIHEPSSVITSTKEDPFDSPEGITKHFFETLRSGDFEASMGCFTPAFQNEYKAALAISSQILKVGSSDLGAIIGAFIGGSTREDYRDYRFEITGTEKLDDTHTNVTFDVYVGGDFDRSSQLACIKYGDEWYLDDAPMSELTEEATKPQYYFTLYEPFKNGSFAGQYNLPEGYSTTEYDVLVNENYQIVFQKKTDDIIWRLPFGDDGYSAYLDKVANHCAIIDSNGVEQCGFDDTEDTTYEIVGHDGQGVFLLNKHVANAFENAYYMCAIDPQGNALAPEVAYTPASFYGHVLSFHFDYCGEGIFLSTDYEYIYNFNTNAMYHIDNRAAQPKKLNEVGFHDGYAHYVYNREDISAGRYNAVTPDVFASYDAYMAWFECVKALPDYEGIYSNIEFVTPTVPAPPCDFPDSVQILHTALLESGCYVVFLRGADKCYYLTLTDANGTMLYDPVYIEKESSLVPQYENYINNCFHNSCFAMYDAERQGVYILNPDGTEQTFLPLPEEGDYNVIGYDDSHIYVKKAYGKSSIVDIETGEVHSTIR